MSTASDRRQLMLLTGATGYIGGRLRKRRIFLANQIYDKALLRFGQGNIDFKW